MVDIIHRVGIQAPIAEVYSALATTEGIAGWWTQSVTGVSELGGMINVCFHSVDGTEVGSMTMEVAKLEPNARVQWSFQNGPAEWLGTAVRFDLTQQDNFTIVRFSHSNWREAVEFMAHCSMKWATFLLSLKRLVESGKGNPAPNDLKIDNWN